MDTPSLATLVDKAHVDAGTARAEAVVDAIERLFPIGQTLAAYHAVFPAEPVADKGTGKTFFTAEIALPRALTSARLDIALNRIEKSSETGWSYDRAARRTVSAHVQMDRRRRVEEALAARADAAGAFWDAATQDLGLLGGATRFTIAYGWTRTDAFRAALSIDGYTVWRQNDPVGPGMLRKRLAPLFASFHALDAAFSGAAATRRWCWADSDGVVAAPSPEAAFFKRIACLQPHAPFDPRPCEVGHSPIAEMVDEDRLADRVADLRRAFSPSGHPLL